MKQHKVKFRKCRFCKKKVENGPGLHIVLDFKKKSTEFYHLGCAIKNNLMWGKE